MRLTILILTLFFSAFIFAQDADSTNREIDFFNYFMNYVPKNFESDTIYKPDSPFLPTELNTIGSLKTYSQYRCEFKLSDNDISWIENRIDDLAIALFLEGKRILFNADGGYNGCQGKRVATIHLNTIEIINLNFCYACSQSKRDYDFIRVFNARMNSLMKTEPPNT